MRRWLLTCVVAAAGCGRIAFDARDDAATDTPDAPFPTGPFGTPVALAELNSTSADDDPSMTGDHLELFFMSGRTGADLLYTSTRDAVTEPWRPPTRVTEIDGTDPINNPKVSPDGLTLVFSTLRPPSAGANDIWIASRLDRQSPWTSSPIVELSSTDPDYEPCLDAAKLIVFFTSDRLAGDADPYTATRPDVDSPFVGVRLVPELMTNGYDGGIFVGDHGRLVLMHNVSNPTLDIFQATRASVDDAFGPLVPLTEINQTTSGETDPFLSADGRTLLFVSDRAGTNDLYIATR